MTGNLFSFVFYYGVLLVLPCITIKDSEDKQPMSKKKARQNDASETETTQTEKPGEEISEQTWLITSLLIVATGAFLRCYQLALKPFHHDEGVNGFFMMRLVREGVYQYDPANYHGPTIYYFALVSSKLFGFNTIAMRLVPAFFGIATIWLVLCLRRYIGSIGALAAAGLIAISPGAVYLSRYFIHESHFVFFTLGIVVAALFYYESGNLLYLVLGAISAALLFATKETAFISVGVVLIAWGCAIAYINIARNGLPWDSKEDTKARKNFIVENQRTDWIEKSGGQRNIIINVLIALSVFIFVYILFYTSFFTHKKGFWDSFEAFKIWSKTSSKDHAENGTFAYVRWLAKEEMPLLILSTVGFLVALWKGRNRFSLFAGAWAFGITSAYTLIAYKTPWLALSFIIPLSIISGYAINEFGLTVKDNLRKGIAWAVVLTAIISCSAQTISLNFFNYDKNDTYPYIYAHTTREFLDMVREFEKYAKKIGNEDLNVAVVSRDYWPLPWYTKDYKGVGYFGNIVPIANSNMVIASEEQQVEIESKLEDRFVLVGTYPMRPGVVLLLYVRRDYADK